MNVAVEFRVIDLQSVQRRDGEIVCQRLFKITLSIGTGSGTRHPDPNIAIRFSNHHTDHRVTGRWVWKLLVRCTSGQRKRNARYDCTGF